MTHSTKEAQPEEDPSVSARLQRLQNNYEDFGMRRTVEGVLVVHDHGHPHILMLQIANAFFKLYVLPCSLHFLPFDVTSSPGDYLKPGEDELEGLKRRLDDRLAPPSDSRQFNASHGIDNDWEIGDCIAQWWRPNFETFMVCNALLHLRRSENLTMIIHPRAHSTHLFLRTSPNLKSAKNFSLCKCPSVVRLSSDMLYPRRILTSLS